MLAGLARLINLRSELFDSTHPCLTRDLSSIRPLVHHGERLLGLHQDCPALRSRCCGLGRPAAAPAVALLQHHTAVAALTESVLVRVRQVLWLLPPLQRQGQGMVNVGDLQIGRDDLSCCEH